jgi:hypothetical protein
MTCAIRAIVSAGLVAALMGALHLGTAGADEPDADASSTKSTEESENDSTEAAPTTVKPAAAKRSKKASQPFEPTERIEAESVISFPANI